MDSRDVIVGAVAAFPFFIGSAVIYILTENATWTIAGWAIGSVISAVSIYRAYSRAKRRLQESNNAR
jgi:membrane protein implicated in regulation of membrane protease activity